MTTKANFRNIENFIKNLKNYNNIIMIYFHFSPY